MKPQQQTAKTPEKGRFALYGKLPGDTKETLLDDTLNSAKEVADAKAEWIAVFPDITVQLKKAV